MKRCTHIYRNIYIYIYIHVCVCVCVCVCVDLWPKSKIQLKTNCVGYVAMYKMAYLLITYIIEIHSITVLRTSLSRLFHENILVALPNNMIGRISCSRSICRETNQNTNKIKGKKHIKAKVRKCCGWELIRSSNQRLVLM